MNPAYEVNVLDGLRNVGVNVDETLAEVYETWCNDPANKKEEIIYTSDRFFPEMPLDEEMVKEASERNNKAVVVIGRIVGENNDMQNNKGGWLLTDDETKMLELVTKYFDQVTVYITTALWPIWSLWRIWALTPGLHGLRRPGGRQLRRRYPLRQGHPLRQTDRDRGQEL